MYILFRYHTLINIRDLHLLSVVSTLHLGLYCVAAYCTDGQMAVACLNPCEELCIEYRIPGSCVESDECIPGCQCPPGRLSISAQNLNWFTSELYGLFGIMGCLLFTLEK